MRLRSKLASSWLYLYSTTITTNLATISANYVQQNTNGIRGSISFKQGNHDDATTSKGNEPTIYNRLDHEKGQELMMNIPKIQQEREKVNDDNDEPSTIKILDDRTNRTNRTNTHEEDEQLTMTMSELAALHRRQLYDYEYLYSFNTTDGMNRRDHDLHLHVFYENHPWSQAHLQSDGDSDADADDNTDTHTTSTINNTNFSRNKTNTKKGKKQQKESITSTPTPTPPTDTPSSIPTMISANPIRIVYETSELEHNIIDHYGRSSNGDELIQILRMRVLPQISEIWSDILSIAPVTGNITIPSNVCYDLFPRVSSDPSSSTYLKELHQYGVPNADLVIFVSGASVSPTTGQSLCGPKTLASANYCHLDQVDRPIIGFINFCLDNISGLSASHLTNFTQTSNKQMTKNIQPSGIINQAQIEKMVKVGVHEVAHILGFNDDLFRYFRDRETGNPLTARPFVPKMVTCVDGSRRKVVIASESTIQYRHYDDVQHDAGGDDSGIYDNVKNMGSSRGYEIVTPSVKQTVRNQFGCQTLLGARLENQPTRKSSCTGTHWDERLFLTEAMGPIYSSKSGSVLSPLTIALLEDSGFYVVDYTSPYIENTPFGLGAGCDFVHGDCIDRTTDAVPDAFKPYFCDKVTKISNGRVDPSSESGCDPSFTNIAYCDLFDFSKGGGMTPTQHFRDPNLGVMFAHADYCPVPVVMKLDCTDVSNHPFQRMYSMEEYSSSSKCFNTKYTHPKNGIVRKGACFKSKCNHIDRTVEVFIAGKMFRCDRDGQIHTFPFSKNNAFGLASFECPPLRSLCPEMFCPAMCSSRGVCNYNASPAPRCECFDKTDTSAGCFGDRYNPDHGTVKIDVGTENDADVFFVNKPNESSLMNQSAMVFVLVFLTTLYLVPFSQ